MSKSKKRKNQKGNSFQNNGRMQANTIITVNEFKGNITTTNDADATASRIGNEGSAAIVEQDYQDLWDEVLRFSPRRFNYVIMTDDSYLTEDSKRFGALKNINLSLLIDVGVDLGTRILYSALLDCYASTKEIISLSAGNPLVTFRNTLNVLSARKDAGTSSYLSLWSKSQEMIFRAIKKLVDESRQTPLVFILDFSDKSAAFRNKFISSLVGSIKLPSGTRFAILRSDLPDALSEDINYLQEECKLSFMTFPKASLLHVSQSCSKYLFNSKTQDCVEIPAMSGVETISERDLISFNTSIELIFPGCERVNNYDETELSNRTDAGNEHFYKGNESSWRDIAENIDLPLLEEREYERKLNEFKKFIENSSRVSYARILHGAGAGGTTLSKRILWDLKNTYPCARLLKYNANTAKILIEIYRRTGLCVLLTIEEGSSVIGEEELSKLRKDVDSSNCKLVVLRVQRDKEERGKNNKATNDRIHTAFKLLDTMTVSVANEFFVKFSDMTTDPKRREMLRKITTNTDFIEQRSPFFYGFYTYQEEYEFDNIYRTVDECTENEKNILSDLALITIFSQNICISDAEICERLGTDKTGYDSDRLTVLSNLPSAVSKLTSQHIDGFRVCHPIIAKKILTRIYGNYDLPESNSSFGKSVFAAAKSYIQNLSLIYGDDNEFVDDILKELIIDRAFIDAEERRTKFSTLIEAIPVWSEKKIIFELLINKFPKNPHYYNHLARLLATGNNEGNITPSFDKAVEIAKKAISVASDNDFEISTHYTNLGCIYSQWILHYLSSESKNAKQKRCVSDYPTLISEISNRCQLAEEYFEKARELNKTDDRFNYYPQINMEARIISRLIQCDRHQRNDCKRLIEEEETFKNWYDEHFAIATELLIAMKKFTSKDDTFLKDATHKVEIANANHNEDYFSFQLAEILKSQTSSSLRRHSRSVIYSAFVRNGSKWDNMAPDVLSLSEKCARKNLLANDYPHNHSDIKTWFELYRRLFSFDEEEAQRIISDYMDDGYEKEYLLFLITFLLYEKGQATRQDVEYRINEASRLAHNQGLNTARVHDIYVRNESIKGCPIVPNIDMYAEMKRKKYTGTVQVVDQTNGKILMDRLNLEVMFVPNPNLKQQHIIGENSERRTFTRDDIGSKVQFNLMFAYSGLRAFNTVKELKQS